MGGGGVDGGALLYVSIHMMNGDDEQYGTSQPDRTKAKIRNEQL